MESAPCGWNWISALWRFPDWGEFCLSSGQWTWISLWRVVPCPVVSFWVSMHSLWLWAACLLRFSIIFLFHWRTGVGRLGTSTYWPGWAWFWYWDGGLWRGSDLLMSLGINSSLMDQSRVLDSPTSGVQALSLKLQDLTSHTAQKTSPQDSW